MQTIKTQNKKTTLEDPIHKIFWKCWGSSKKLEDDPQYLSQKNTKFSKYIKDPLFLPSNFWGSSKFSLKIEDLPSIFWKGNPQNIWKIYPQNILRIFYSENIEDFLGRSQFPKMFRSSPKILKIWFFSVMQVLHWDLPTREKKRSRKSKQLKQIQKWAPILA